MATNFPNTSEINPDTGVVWADGDAFDDTGDSGLIYYWYDPVWNTEFRPTAASDARYVEVAGDTMTGNLTVPSLNDGPLAGFRNQVINGDFQVNQYPSIPTPITDTGYYTDRWFLNGPDTNGVLADTVNMTRVVADGSNLPSGFAYGLSISTAGSYNLQQGIELGGTDLQGHFYTGSQWTISLWSTVDLTSIQGRLDWKVQPAVAGDAASSRPNFETTNETSNGFTRYKATVTIDNDVSGDDKECLVLMFLDMPDGTFTGVQLEPGPVETPFEHRPYGIELALCQRYYQRFNRNNSGVVLCMQSGASGRRFVLASQKIPMRPGAITAYNALRIKQMENLDTNLAGNKNYDITGVNVGNRGVVVIATDWAPSSTDGTFTLGNPIFYYPQYSGGTADAITIDAEF